jgi:hypothetical protein
MQPHSDVAEGSGRLPEIPAFCYPTAGFAFASRKNDKKFR